MQVPNQNELANTLANELLREKRKDRFWKNVRFICWFALFAFVVISIVMHYKQKVTGLSGTSGFGNYVALIRLDGMIAPGREFSAEKVVPILRSAFADKDAKGVVIDINSPGGTPVQASIIHDAILIFKRKYNKKVIVVGEDLLTSGAYFVSVAADKIYVNPNTLTGSIGVIMKGFGFVDAIKKLGIDRRVYTAGTQKDRLDPFLPQNPEDLEKMKSVMQEVHQNFANAVREGRKGKIHGDPSTLFTGDFWTGQTALNLGLVDGIGNLLDVMNKEFQTMKFIEYSGTPNIFRLISGQLSSTFDTLTYY